MDKAKRAEQIAVQILKYSRNELLVSLRFMDLALCKLEYKMEDIKRTATDGKYLYYNPKHIFSLYEAGDAELNHSHLHTIFHCIFYHPFVNKAIEQPLWDLACDIAVEGILSELNMKQLECASTLLINQELENLKNKYGKLTAERLYRKFLASRIKASEILRLQKIFAFDDHLVWYVEQEEKSEKKTKKTNDSGEAKKSESGETVAGTAVMLSGAVEGEDKKVDSGVQAEWQEISERIKMDVETFSNERGGHSEGLIQNLAEVNREKYDYTEFLRKFAILGEEMRINDDEFDYIFYTYGLQMYKNVPLVEPLEYKDVKRIIEFVLAIDTSGSVEGDLVQLFVQKTYNVLKSTESFFSKINLHIIQCDDQIQEDIKITSQEEFDEYFKHMQLKGFGGNNEVLLFSYVDDLIHKGEFQNLKGMIYFTDGYGIFPEKKPDYDVAFVFVENERWPIPTDIPPWVIKLVLEKEDL